MKVYFPPLFIFICTLTIGCKQKQTAFSLIDPNHSNIHFNNEIVDNDSMNILDLENIYNGGGVGIADFNLDGLQDIYFAGNIVESKLYLNRGDFEFEDITRESGTNGQGRWCRGVSVVDINNDSLPDIYVSASLHPDYRRRTNLLYVHQGLNENGIPVFADKAAEYNLADTSHSTMAAFFDYDNDGDLDIYLLVNQIIKAEYPNKFRYPLRNGEHPSTGKLFRNDPNDSTGHAWFTDVSRDAGITIEGYGHGVNICDLNADGWKDIYVANDFLSNNILYINNQDGTFTDRVTEYLKHTSENSMGMDIADINNDGLPDIIEADMNPEDNFRKKMMLNPIGYQRYINNETYGYQHQYVRNTFQLNGGMRPGNSDSSSIPVFSDIGFLAGIAETDWSWAPLISDFDDDGFKDLVITNGFPKDVTDHDFIVYRNKASMLASKRELLDEIPEVKIPNYAFRGINGLRFENATKQWGLSTPSFSNGAAIGDLDNDGDMDLVISNINDKAFVYRNNSKNNYLNIKLKGDPSNQSALGSRIEIRSGGRLQVQDNSPYRGYLSSYQQLVHFGLGKMQRVDTLDVFWPDGGFTRKLNVDANQLITISKNDSRAIPLSNRPITTLFTDFTIESGFHYVHSDSDYIDFDIQRLLPHKFSQYGPALASADLNGDGLDDLVVGGSFYYPAIIYLQQVDGRFATHSFDTAAGNFEDAGILLFDAENDGDTDIFLVAGSSEAKDETISYADRLFLNDGKAGFTLAQNALPQILYSKSCARASDWDKDGDLDLFIGGRLRSGKYPQPVSSILLRNDSKNGQPSFTDVTGQLAPELIETGLVCDAVFSDYNGDSWPDLIIAGEWMPVRVLKNEEGKFKEVTNELGLSDYSGWWNSIYPADVDNDGDMDYVAGNLGLNSYYRGSKKEPVSIYAGDLDKNGGYDAFPALFLKTSFQNEKRNEYPANLRDEVIKEIPSIRAKFYTYRSFAEVKMKDLFSKEQWKNANASKATHFASSLIINEGRRFVVKPLPDLAQVAPVFGINAGDFDGNGTLDLLLNGNDFGTEVLVGRYDAMNGLFLAGDGKGNFSPLSAGESGFYIPGNGKAIITFKGAGGNCLVAASQNRGALKIFKPAISLSSILLNHDDQKYILFMNDRSSWAYDAGYGQSFYSQSSRRIFFDSTKVNSVHIIASNGRIRKIKVGQ